MDKKKKNVLIGTISSLTGISGFLVGSTIIAYDNVFDRYERPDYDLVLGQYCYERIKDELTREEIKYKSKDNQLIGYYYKSINNKGLVIMVHGFKSGADNYLPLINYVVQKGYNVFAYNMTGTFESDGQSTIGMCQSLIDLDNTIKFIKNNPLFTNQNLYLIGHSMGGYAAASVLALHNDIKACACIAPMYNGNTIMLEKGEQYVGKVSKITKPVFSIYQKYLFGDYINYNSVDSINSSNIPVLIAHGVEDKIITFNEQSIIAHKKEITNPNVKYYIAKGLQSDHDNIWHSNEAIIYQKQIASELKLMEFNKGDKLSLDEIKKFNKTVNHKLYSEVNKDLLNMIIEMFDTTKKN